MRFLFGSLVLATAVAAYGASIPRELTGLTEASSSQRILPGGYIVELASASSTKRSLDVHAEFLDALDKRSAGSFRTRQQYRNELFNGIAVQLISPEELVDLASLPNVIAVRPLYIHPAPEPVDRRIVEEGEEHPVLGRSVHILTGVDVAHAAGYKGKDVQIAIIDSGVDYTHPALGGGFGPGFKIAGGTDLVGDAYDGENTPVPDDDPIDCLGHGTHVAGIIGANPGNTYDVVGVAPEASIFIYKVGGCRGGIGDDVIVAAMLHAAEEGANVISMSFGSADGWTNSFIAEVASRVAEQGIVVTASAGNSGDAGVMYFSTPAVGENVIGVGSVENTAIITQTFVTNVRKEPFKYTNLAYPNIPGTIVPGVPATPLPVLALRPFPDGIDSKDCQSLPADIPADLSGLAIVLYGSDNFECAVVEFVSMRNPAVIINYKNPYMVFNTGFPSILISDEDGLWLAEQSQAANITVTIPGPPLEDSTGDAGGLMNDFSTLGPGNRLEFEPAVSAPGGDIMSTYLDGKWAILSGTSMSNPYTAGSAALVLQAKGKGAASSVRALLQTTSQSLPSTRAEGALPQTLAYQGSGLINVIAAINTQTTITPAALLLNDTAHWNEAHTITISNSGAESQVYSLAHVAAGTTVSKPADLPDFNLGPVPLISAPVAVSFSKQSVNVPAGESATVDVTITAPANVDARTLPIVSGWITATSESGETVKVSYIGMAATFQDAQTISTSAKLNGGRDPLPGIIAVDEPRFQTGPKNYTMRDPSSYPVYHFGLSAPSAHIIVDLVDATTDIQPNVPHAGQGKAKRTWSNWMPSRPGSQRLAAAPEYPIIAPLAVYDYFPRGAYRTDNNRIFLQEFANGTHIPLGQYKVLLRALRPFGNPDNEEDYDVHVSVQFGWVP